MFKFACEAVASHITVLRRFNRSHRKSLQLNKTFEFSVGFLWAFQEDCEV